MENRGCEKKQKKGFAIFPGLLPAVFLAAVFLNFVFCGDAGNEGGGGRPEQESPALYDYCLLLAEKAYGTKNVFKAFRALDTAENRKRAVKDLWTEQLLRENILDEGLAARLEGKASWTDALIILKRFLTRAQKAEIPRFLLLGGFENEKEQPELFDAIRLAYYYRITDFSGISDFSAVMPAEKMNAMLKEYFNVNRECPSDAFVDLAEEIPGVFIDLRYASSDNFTGRAVYDYDRAWLRYSSAQKLKAAQAELLELGFSLKIWDAWRKPKCQFLLWEAMPDPRYIANPNTGHSAHSRGAAVDVTLVRLDGSEAEMPTNFDDFSERAARGHAGASAEAQANSLLLETVMQKHGFAAYSNEWWHFSDSESAGFAAESDPKPLSFAATLPKKRIELTVSAVGDCVLGRDDRFDYDLSFNYYKEVLKKPDSYFFANAAEIFFRSDLTVANAENVFAAGGTKTPKPPQPGGEFWFLGDPAYVNIFKEGGVNAVNIANNHSHDYGEAALRESIGHLNKAGILAFGYGMTAVFEAKGVKIALLGYNVLGPLEEGTDINEMKAAVLRELEAAKTISDLQIVSFHWGAEYEEVAGEQRELGRWAVDCGADLVLGHHSHCPQPVETYKGKQIVYSLGNFVYGGASQPKSIETVIFRQKFVLDLDSKEILLSSYDVIDALVHPPGPFNNYQPVLRACLISLNDADSEIFFRQTRKSDAGIATLRQGAMTQYGGKRAGRWAIRRY
ncbi:MAG: CapA family protein [Clostridiales bacterium]|nr:CapA family protein [Clostridiales bacterium]